MCMAVCQYNYLAVVAVNVINYWYCITLLYSYHAFVITLKNVCSSEEASIVLFLIGSIISTTPSSIFRLFTSLYYYKHSNQQTQWMYMNEYNIT